MRPKLPTGLPAAKANDYRFKELSLCQGKDAGFADNAAERLVALRRAMNVLCTTP